MILTLMIHTLMILYDRLLLQTYINPPKRYAFVGLTKFLKSQLEGRLT